MMISSDMLRRFVADEAGQDLVEYALIAGFLGFAAIVGLRSLATHVGTVFATVGTTLTGPV